MVNLFGGSGYIGSVYQRRFDVIMQDRDDLVPQHNRVLYMISTNHNHHLPRNPWIDVDTNIVTLLRVLEQCRGRADMEFNFVSSWFVYGNCLQPVNEQHACDPRGFYSITKHTAERLLQEYCNLHGIKWRILRLCNVVGGIDTSAGDHKNALHNALRKLMHDHDLRLAAGGNFHRNYLHVEDVCDAMAFIIDHAPPNQIINVSSGPSVSFAAAVDFARTVLDSKSHISSDKDTPVVDCRLDSSKLSGMGWKHYDTWQRTIQHVIQDLICQNQDHSE